MRAAAYVAFCVCGLAVVAACDIDGILACTQKYSDQYLKIANSTTTSGGQLDELIKKTCDWAGEYRGCLIPLMRECNEAKVKELEALFDRFNKDPFNCNTGSGAAIKGTILSVVVATILAVTLG